MTSRTCAGSSFGHCQAKAVIVAPPHTHGALAGDEFAQQHIQCDAPVSPPRVASLPPAASNGQCLSASQELSAFQTVRLRATVISIQHISNTTRVAVVDFRARETCGGRMLVSNSPTFLLHVALNTPSLISWYLAVEQDNARSGVFALGKQLHQRRLSAANAATFVRPRFRNGSASPARSGAAQCNNNLTRRRMAPLTG